MIHLKTLKLDSFVSRLEITIEQFIQLLVDIKKELTIKSN